MDEILIITSKIQYNNLINLGIKERILIDIIPGKAAIGGIYTGLLYSTNQYNLVVGCDMPFLNMELIKYMISEVVGYDALVIKMNNFLEPLHAIYSKNCALLTKRFVEENNLSLNQLFSLVKTRYLTGDEVRRYDPRLLSIFNINTQEDYFEAIKILNESG